MVVVNSGCRTNILYVETDNIQFDSTQPRCSKLEIDEYSILEYSSR